MKAPAYGALLTQMRRAGHHPLEVTVIYGNDWKPPESASLLRPRLAVKPGEALGLDWHCVTGLPVVVLDRHVEETDEVLRMLGEIGRRAAQVYYWVKGQERPVHVSDWAWSLRHVAQLAGQAAWPSWWSGEVEKINAGNRERWLAAAEQWFA